jgi:hypothetical protein
MTVRREGLPRNPRQEAIPVRFNLDEELFS